MGTTLNMLSEFISSIEFIVQQTRMHLTCLGIILAIPWGMFFLSLLDRKLLLLGIIPRKWYGLPGIIFAPLLHANLNHLFFNSIPLVVLSNFLLIYGVPYYITITVTIVLLSGIMIWCFGKPGIHIGASALITGYWAVLAGNLYHHNTITSVILGLLTVYYFLGIFFSILPFRKGISWEGHLFGLLSGFAIVSFTRMVF